MKIFDCFSYLDEDMLLDMRLNILDKHVDYFVITEGDKTWQNNPKKLQFDYFRHIPSGNQSCRSIRNPIGSH